jgi:outer membrane protein assembly factor BamD (BamD/ComL family)
MSRLLMVALMAFVVGTAAPDGFVFGHAANPAAERDLRVADFYDRTGDTDSAIFYYKLIARRHAGTPFAQIAAQRLEVLEQAVRDYEVAEFYRRADQVGSARFYYELVLRRYPGTSFARKAKEGIAG